MCGTGGIQWTQLERHEFKLCGQANQQSSGDGFVGFGEMALYILQPN